MISCEPISQNHLNLGPKPGKLELILETETETRPAPDFEIPEKNTNTIFRNQFNPNRSSEPEPESILSGLKAVYKYMHCAIYYIYMYIVECTLHNIYYIYYILLSSS